VARPLFNVADGPGEPAVQCAPRIGWRPVLDDGGEKRVGEAQPLALAVEHLGGQRRLQALAGRGRIVEPTQYEFRGWLRQRGDAAKHVARRWREGGDPPRQQAAHVGDQRRGAGALGARELERRQGVAARGLV
jgi:hypothetical protein